MKTRRFRTKDGRVAVKAIAATEEEWKMVMEDIRTAGTMASRLRPGRGDATGQIRRSMERNYKESDPLENGMPSTVLLEDDFTHLLSAFLDATRSGSLMAEVIMEDMEKMK